MNAPRWIALCLACVLPPVAYRLGGSALWYAFLAGYAVAAGLTAWSLWRDGELSAALRPRAGDPSFGIALAAVLFLAVQTFMLQVLAPTAPLRLCTPDGAWVLKPDVHGLAAAGEWLRDRGCQAFARSAGLRGPLRSAMVPLIAVLEEVAWRGGVQPLLSERVGSTRGWLLASALYALAHFATGNVVLGLLALPCGLAWGALVRFRGRVAPAVLSHAVFSWFMFYNATPFSMHAGR